METTTIPATTAMTPASPAPLTLAETLHAHCVICGQDHPSGMCLQFEPGDDGEGVQANLRVGSRFQGYNGLVHGGVIASILDAAMTHCLLQQDTPALTAQLNVRYKNPLPVDQPIRVQAKILVKRTPYFELRAEISSQGRLIAYAGGQFMLARGESENDCTQQS